MAKRARHGRIYIDYLRNGRGATAVGAYTPRARPGAPVSTPVSWEEVENGVKPDEFTVETVPQRLASLRLRPLGGDRQDPPIDQRCGAAAGRDPVVSQIGAVVASGPKLLRSLRLLGKNTGIGISGGLW